MANASGEKFSRLVEIMARLRGPGGCPWDRGQTHASLRPNLVEDQGGRKRGGGRTREAVGARRGAERRTGPHSGAAPRGEGIADRVRLALGPRSVRQGEGRGGRAGGGSRGGGPHRAGGRAGRPPFHPDLPGAAA